MLCRKILSATAALLLLSNAAVAQTVPKVRWHTDPVAAYYHAAWEQKPIVAYFFQRFRVQCGGKCRNCQRLEQDVLFSQNFATLADKAVFLWVDCDRRNTDMNVAQLVKNLGITGCPAVSILDVTPPNFVAERGRVVGYSPLREFQDNFTAQWNNRRFSQSGPGSWNERGAGYGYRPDSYRP